MKRQLSVNYGWSTYMLRDIYKTLCVCVNIYIYIYIYIYILYVYCYLLGDSHHICLVPLSSLDNSLDILAFLVPRHVVNKYVNEWRFIIHPISPVGLKEYFMGNNNKKVSTISWIIAWKQCIRMTLKIKFNMVANSTTYKIHLFH